MTKQEYQFDLFADYFQFYLQDEPVEGNLGDSWTPEAVDRLLALAPGTIGVGTVRNMDVPVKVEIQDSPPNDSFDEWDQVNECSIEIASGKVVVAGCTDFFADAARIKVTPGTYRARIYYGRLDELSADGIERKDHYRVVLWLAPSKDLVVLKQRDIKHG